MPDVAGEHQEEVIISPKKVVEMKHRAAEPSPTTASPRSASAVDRHGAQRASSSARRRSSQYLG